MKERELRELTECCVCNEPVVGRGKLPIFITASIAQHGLDAGALQRQQGLAMMLGGNGALAMHMGPDEDMTQTVMEETKVSLCHACAMDSPIFMAAMDKAEKASNA